MLKVEEIVDLYKEVAMEQGEEAAYEYILGEIGNDPELKEALDFAHHEYYLRFL